MEIREYIAYECMTCGKTTILIKSEVMESKGKNNYVTCGHDGRHGRMREIGQYDDLNQCMQERAYKRAKGGALKEIR